MVNAGVKSGAVTVVSRRVSPAFFLVAGYAAARHYPDYKLVAKPDAFPGCADPVDCPATEAQPGETVLLYGTGFGAVGADGLTRLQVRVRFAGGAWTDAAAGLSSAGVYQVVVGIAENATTGDLEVEAEIGGRQSPAVKLTVRR